MKGNISENAHTRQAITQRTRYKIKSTLKIRGILRPQYLNKINLFITKERPSLIIIGQKMNVEQKYMLEKLGFTKTIWTKILKNHTILTVDELVNISKFLKCNLDDLI